MSKTAGIEHIGLQYVVPNSVITGGGIIDVENEAAISVFAHYCQVNNTDHMVAPPTFRVEAKYDSVEHWWPITSWQPDRTAPANAELATSAPSGSLTLNVDAIPAFWTLGEYAFVQHIIDASPFDLTSSEFVRLKSYSGTIISLFDATKLTHSVVPGNTIYVLNRAQQWVGHIDTKAIASLRVMIDASQCDKEFAAEVHISLLDSNI